MLGTVISETLMLSTKCFGIYLMLITVFVKHKEKDSNVAKTQEMVSLLLAHTLISGTLTVNAQEPFP